MPQAIHAEPNPCPDRHLFVFDFTNHVNKDDVSRMHELPRSRLVSPPDKLMRVNMFASTSSDSIAFS